MQRRHVGRETRSGFMRHGFVLVGGDDELSVHREKYNEDNSQV